MIFFLCQLFAFVYMFVLIRKNHSWQRWKTRWFVNLSFSICDIGRMVPDLYCDQTWVYQLSCSIQWVLSNNLWFLLGFLETPVFLPHNQHNGQLASRPTKTSSECSACWQFWIKSGNMMKVWFSAKIFYIPTWDVFSIYIHRPEVIFLPHRSNLSH